MRHQEIIFALTGQSFHFDPPEGRPTGTPTVEVFSSDVADNGTAETATTGACSVDAVDTTLDGAIGAGVTSATLLDATGVTKGRRYLLTGTDGESEWVEVRAKVGELVTFRQPTVNAYETGSTFEGCRISISIDSTWVADETNLTVSGVAAGAAGYRLRWSYTVDSTATIGVSYADLVRYQSKNLVGPLDVDRLFPGWINRLGPDDYADQGAALIDEAFQAVRMDALTDDQLLHSIRDTQVLAELVKYRANVLTAQNQVFHGTATRDALTLAQELYERRYKSLIREPKVPVDHAGDGTSGQAQRLPAWRR